MYEFKLFSVNKNIYADSAETKNMTYRCFGWVIHFEMSTILAILLSPTILKDTESIIDFMTPPAAVIICNLKSSEVYNTKTPPHIFLFTLLAQAAIPIFFPKITL